MKLLHSINAEPVLSDDIKRGIIAHRKTGFKYFYLKTVRGIDKLYLDRLELDSCVFEMHTGGPTGPLPTDITIVRL